MLSIKEIMGDIRNWAVNLIMTAVLAFVVAIGVAIWKAFKQQPLPWTLLISLTLVGIILLTIAIIKISKVHNARTPPTEKDSDDTTQRFKIAVGVNHISDNILTDGHSARYHHAQVWIDSGTVHGCKVYLTHITGKNKSWQGHEQLTFRPSEAVDTLSKAIYAGVKYDLDVLRVTSGNDIHVCNMSRQWTQLPRLHNLFAAHGIYDLTLVIAGEDATAENFSVLFQWTGNWQTSFLTEAKRASQPHRLDSNRSAAVNKVVDEAMRIIRGDKRLYNFPLYALQMAGVGNLQTEDEFAEARESIIQHNLPDPLVGLPSLYSPGNEPKWLEVIKSANRNGVDLSSWDVLMDCVNNYSKPPS